MPSDPVTAAAQLSSTGTSKLTLGDHLRALRTARKMSLSDVSALSGLATSTLSRVENGQLSLTYDKLLQLCNGLQIEVSSLFDPVKKMEPSNVPVGRRTMTPPSGGRPVQAGLQFYNYLCTELSNKKMTPMIGVVTGKTLEEVGGLKAHEGEEFSYVMEGKLHLHTEFYEPLEVEVGGSIYFDSTMRHAYVSVGDVPLKFICVISAPKI